jgi:hypothetical protein
MICKIRNGQPDQNPLRLFRNSGNTAKRVVIWKSLDRTYVVKVPPNIFVDRTTPDECLILVDQGHPALVLLKRDAAISSYPYQIIDASDEIGTDTPPEIIVNDEGPIDKGKKKARRRKSARKPAVKKAPQKQPPAEKAA